MFSCHLIPSEAKNPGRDPRSMIVIPSATRDPYDHREVCVHPAVRRLRAVFLVAAFVFLLSSPLLAQSPPANHKPDLLWQKLEGQIEQADHELDGVLGLYLVDLTDGRQFALYADEVMPTASTIKIAVLAELYRQAQQGKLHLNDPYTVRREDIVPDSDIMGGLTPGTTRVTLRDLATMVAAVSDNSAANVLIDRVGMDNVNAMLDSLVLPQTRLRRKMMDLKAAAQGRENVATPREIALLLAYIYQGKLLNKEMTDDLLQVLSTNKDSPFRHALPPEVRSADKPGELEAVRNDCGIIFATNRPFVLCAMTTYDRDERQAEAILGRLARLSFDYFDRVGRASPLGRVISSGNSGPPR